MSRDAFRVKRFMKQIKRLKSVLEKFAAAPRECKMADEADGESEMYVYKTMFCSVILCRMSKLLI